MSDKTRQAVKSGDNSTTIQAGTIIIQQSDEEKMRTISREVMRSELSVLTDTAAKTFRQRADEMTETLLSEIRETAEFDIDKFQQPSFQLSLNDAQREFGKMGGDELKKGLVQLLVKIGQEKNDEKERLYEEAIKTLPLLSMARIHALTLICGVRNITYKPSNFNKLFENLQKDLLSFVETAATSDFSFNHMEYSKVGKLDMGTFNFADSLAKKYPAIFMNGIAERDIQELVLPVTKEKFFIPCFHDGEKLQLKYMDNEALDTALKTEKVSEEEIDELRQLFNKSKMKSDQIKKVLVEKDARFDRLFNYFDNTQASRFSLSSVGMIIGIIEIETVGGEQINLSEWIKD